MNYEQALNDNLKAFYDAKLSERQAKELSKELESQWNELSDAFKAEQIDRWIDYMIFGKLRLETLSEWEAANPGWKTCNNSIRKSKP